MPTYDYRCKDCDYEFEIEQSFSDDALTTCPTCGGSLKKIFSAVGISFKGSGFYKNDARGATSSTTPAKTEKSGDAAAAKSDSGGGSSADKGSSPSSTSASTSGSTSTTSSP